MGTVPPQGSGLLIYYIVCVEGASDEEEPAQPPLLSEEKHQSICQSCVGVCVLCACICVCLCVCGCLMPSTCALTPRPPKTTCRITGVPIWSRQGERAARPSSGGMVMIEA